MRWPTKPYPRPGDSRVVRRFALFPVQLTDGWTVWLEDYHETEIYYSRRLGWEGWRTDRIVP